MNDMSRVIIPKSDQINADDLLAGPRTITVASVSIRPGTEQPVSIHFDGDEGKPYKPCKSMCRVMVQLWGPDANNYVGRSMTLYCDPSVVWGGMKVGGIRISHMTHIEGTATLALTATKGSRKPFTVKPLAVEKPKAEAPAEPTFLDKVQGHLNAAPDRDAVAAVRGSKSVMSAYAKAPDDVKAQLDAMFSAAFARFPDGELDDDDFPGTVSPREAA
jgi:hypothetical protein